MLCGHVDQYLGRLPDSIEHLRIEVMRTHESACAVQDGTALSGARLLEDGLRESAG